MAETPLYSFRLSEILSWYRSKQRTLQGSGVSLVDIRERAEYLPVAGADFDPVDALGRINGWVSGDFDFEVVRISDGKDLFWRHVHASNVEDLENTFLDFVRHLQIQASPVAESDSTSVFR